MKRKVDESGEEKSGEEILHFGLRDGGGDWAHPMDYVFSKKS
ncbi:MAG: hypothetical protein WCH05_06895 [Chlorobiaceae bacterium]